jgi:hypothetical protein
MTEEALSSRSLPDQTPANIKDGIVYCLRSFKEHPGAVGETYGQHWYFTLTMGLRMIGTGLALLLHGLLPFLFCTTATDQAEKIAEIFKARKEKCLTYNRK